MTLAVLLPSRGRPHNFRRFMEACSSTGDDYRVYVRLDHDDLSLVVYGQVVDDYTGKTSVIVGDRVGFGASLNELAGCASHDGMSRLGMFGDDVVPQTPGWDTALVAALGDRLGVVYGDDGLRNRHSPDLPTHYVTQTEVYRRLGYLAPPGIRHLFLDNVARDIGNVLHHFVFVPVSVRHMHPWMMGEHLHDTTYAEGGRNPEIRLADQRAYITWMREKDWKRRLHA